MSKEDVMDYVMTTPNNPNRAVLEGMLDSIAEAGGGGGIDMLTVTASANPGSPIVVDKTYEELKAIRESGKPLILRINRDGATYTMIALLRSDEDGRGKREEVYAYRVYRYSASEYMAVNYLVLVFASSSFSPEFSAAPDKYSVSNASTDGNAAWGYGVRG